ncbi:MAG: hypothetical protein PHD81_01420 [Candidatus Nanoarchaeia archaeon]|nr:hypothetical protein [Candidatus Nanoarchaeia archaeon]MDD5587748.1 hypothetical protein [Candidatus Nanoarchaeia archaeon]
MAKEMGMCKHSKPMILVGGLILIAIGLWAWLKQPTIVQLFAVLIILMGLHKLMWASKCCK